MKIFSGKVGAELFCNPQKMFDFQMVFKVETDLRINLGYYSICLSKKEGLKIIDDLPKKDKEQLLKHIKSDYEQMKKKALSNDKEGKKWKKSGYVYLLKSGGLYKIGRAENFKQRLGFYKTENPFNVEVIAQFYVEDSIKTERLLLDTFKNKKVKGEWFNLNDKDIQKFQKLRFSK